MPYPAVQIFDNRSAPTEYYVAAEKLISGNPKQSLWAQYTDPTKKFSTGIWQSEPGKWNVNYTEEEFCQQETGVSILTDKDGNSFTVRAGDSYVIPRGFVGTWEVVETTKKRYVIYEA